MSKAGSVAFGFADKSSGVAELDINLVALVAAISKPRFTARLWKGGGETNGVVKYRIEFDVIRTHRGDLVASAVLTRATDYDDAIASGQNGR